MTVKFLLILTLLLSPWVLYSQTIKTIQFVDVKNNEPIQFVQVVQGDTGTTTNFEGKIEIDLYSKVFFVVKAFGFHELRIEPSDLVATDTIFMLHLTKINSGNSTSYVIDPNFKNKEFVLQKENSKHFYNLIEKTNRVMLEIKKYTP